MKKVNKIVYWVATVWLCLGMLSTGIVQLLRVEGEVDFVLALGYPAYFLTLLGIWKVLGVVAVLVPKFPVVKEWAYAGFFFAMSGAIFSHIAMKHTLGEIFPPVLLLALTVLSWYFRPTNRKVSLVNQ
jgi:hypothetical protein